MININRILLMGDIVPEAKMPIKKFHSLHPALYEACQTFMNCSSTESITNQAAETSTTLKAEEATKYLETLIQLYSASEELEQAAALLRLQHDMNLNSEPQTLRL